MARSAGAFVVAAVVMIASGCMGSSTSSPSSSAGVPTRAVITYAVGWGLDPGTCPHGATCTTTTTARTQTLPIHVARLQLGCDPASGDYRNPMRACQAIADYVHLTRNPKPNACRCPGSVYTDHIDGVFHGQRIHVPVSACNACSLGGSAAADFTTLTPRT